MADRAKTMEELVAEASPEARETYSEFGGVESLLDPPSSPQSVMDAAMAEGEFRRARAKAMEEQRAREQRKARLAQEAEEQAAARRAVNEREAAEAEAQLMARLRKEYPPMTDTAWNAMWPQVRASYFAEEHERRMSAERGSELYGAMTNSTF